MRVKQTNTYLRNDYARRMRRASRAYIQGRPARKPLDRRAQLQLAGMFHKIFCGLAHCVNGVN